jgi:glycerophosphoryl diester phosphodiesterase
MFINIELKSQPRGHKGIEKIVAEMIYHHNLTDQVTISSFSPLILMRFAKIAPKIPTAILVGPHPFFFLKTLLSANMLKVSAVNPVFQYTSERLVNFAHNMNWRVFTWTINTRQEFMRAVELEVDGIITDEPELLKLKV